MKKCIPQTRWGSGTPDAISVTGIEEVFVAKTVSGPQSPRQVGEQLSLQVQVLRRRLDHEAAARQALEPGGLEQAGRARSVFGRPEALARPFREGGLQPVGSGGERVRVGVVEDGLVPAEASQLGDPRAHRAGADDPELHLPWKSGFALVEEGRHALDPVLGRHRELVEASLLLEPGGQAGLVGCQHGLLGELGGQGRARGDGPGRGRSPRSARPCRPC